MGYKFILSESEKKEILNKHISYKNFLNEEAMAPSVMDIQLKLINLGFEELLGRYKADGKFGKNTCNAIISALTLLKQKQSAGNMENIPTTTKDCISATANYESFDSFGKSFIMKSNGTVAPENRQILFYHSEAFSKDGKPMQLPPFCKVDVVNSDCYSKMTQKDPSLVGGGSSVDLEGSVQLVNLGTIKSADKDKFGNSVDVKVNGTVFCNITMRIPKGEETLKDESGKIPGKIYPTEQPKGEETAKDESGKSANNAGLDVS